MSKVNEVLEKVKVDLQSIATFNGKTVHVLTEELFFEKIKGSTPPVLGIMYEGMRSKGEVGKDTHRVGLSANLTMALVLVMQSKSPIGGDLRGTAIEYLDQIRTKMKDTRSEAGHYWQFLMEAPALEKGGYTLWLQRWTTPIQLT